MTQTSGGTSPPGHNLRLLLIAVAVLLVIGVAASSGIGPALGLAGLLACVAGLVAVARGRATSLGIVSRRIGWMVAGGGLVAVMIGGAVSPHLSSTASSQQAVAPQHARSLIAHSSAPAPTAAPITSSAEASTSSAPPTTVAPPPPAPVLAMSCPGAGSVASPVFGHRITAVAPYTVVIDYGDGDRYTNDDKHLAAIFTHTYPRAGTFTVGATLTDATGQTASSTCAYSWTRPVTAVAPVGGSSSGGSTGSGGSDTYTNVDGNKVHVPVAAPAPPAGATAKCNDGTYSFSQHHSGTCSHHGGVAQWL